MGKSTHFLGQPLYGQVIKLLDKAEILEISRKNGGERYIKRFDAWTHLMTMLYAVIMRHDSLREISVSMLSESRKLAHLGVSMMPTRSTLSDANARRPEVIVNIYRQRWEIELLFKQIKQNFPLRYFYGESRNAIKIQIWVTLIANLLLITNILTESTDLICTGQGAEQLITTAFHVADEDVENVSAQTGIVKLPGVVSRKKQLAPQIMMALQQ